MPFYIGGLIGSTGNEVSRVSLVANYDDLPMAPPLLGFISLSGQCDKFAFIFVLPHRHGPRDTDADISIYACKCEEC